MLLSHGMRCLQVPWDDLRYIFGEIMYGGHIVEDWDRRLANAYLFKYFNETLLEGMEMFPAFFTPANTMTHKQVSDQTLNKTDECHSCQFLFSMCDIAALYSCLPFPLHCWWSCAVQAAPHHDPVHGLKLRALCTFLSQEGCMT